MEDRSQDNLKELFERFMEPQQADAAARDVRLADQMFEAHPAPEPQPEVILGIKIQIAARLDEQPRAAHRLWRILAASAAIILLALVAFLGRGPQTVGTELSYATLVPTAVWESDDIASDDMDIAYLAAEIRDIEVQVQALETGQTEDIRVATLHEVETELMQINTEFWKE
jgi:hypothetical protein